MAEATFDELNEAFAPGKRFAGDDRLAVRFFMRAVPNEAKSLELGRPVYEEVEYVEIIVPGDKDNTICRRVRTAPIPDARRFPRQYAAFKSNQDQAVVGTPLTVWPGVTRAQVEELKFFKITSVEQLAEMPDTAAQNFAGSTALRLAARAYLERAVGGAGDAKLALAVEEKDKQIAALNDMLAKMTDAVRKLESRMDDSEDKKAKK